MSVIALACILLGVVLSKIFTFYVLFPTCAVVGFGVASVDCYEGRCLLDTARDVLIVLILLQGGFVGGASSPIFSSLLRQALLRPGAFGAPRALLRFPRHGRGGALLHPPGLPAAERGESAKPVDGQGPD